MLPKPYYLNNKHDKMITLLPYFARIQEKINDYLEAIGMFFKQLKLL